MGREVDQAERLHELVDIDAPVLVEVDALRQVCHGLVADLHLEVRAQELPGLMELLKRDQTCQTERQRKKKSSGQTLKKKKKTKVPKRGLQRKE